MNQELSIGVLNHFGLFIIRFLFFLYRVDFVLLNFELLIMSVFLCELLLNSRNWTFRFFKLRNLRFILCFLLCLSFPLLSPLLFLFLLKLLLFVFFFYQIICVFLSFVEIILWLKRVRSYIRQLSFRHLLLGLSPKKWMKFFAKSCQRFHVSWLWAYIQCCFAVIVLVWEVKFVVF